MMIIEVLNSSMQVEKEMECSKEFYLKLKSRKMAKFFREKIEPFPKLKKRSKKEDSPPDSLEESESQS